eukprot:7815531-Ditylum_brightwellii.AAC.1
MSSYDVRRFSVIKKTLSIAISDSQHPHADDINNNSSNIDINETYVECNLDDAIEDDEESTDDVEEELSCEGKVSSEEDEVPAHEKRGDKVSTDKDFYSWDHHLKEHIHWVLQKNTV